MAAEARAPQGGTLNVIFHGSCAFLLDGNVEAIIPDVPNYIFVAGTFLQEHPLEKGASYRLVGVQPAGSPAARIATGSNVFMLNAEVQADAPIYCELHLKLPTAFHSLRPVDVDPAWFPTPPPCFKVPLQIALVHVLTYEFEDAAALAILDGSGNKFPWSPEYNSTTKTVNLHIYSDPDANAPPDPFPATTLLTKLFGLDVPLETGLKGPFVSPPNVYPEIRGLEQPAELVDYSSGRPARAHLDPPYNCLPGVGKMKRRHKPDDCGAALPYSVSVDAYEW
ncbi:MAG: hypothetical protein ACLP59_26720 [Bryobacteraceae bacterium]